MRLRYWVELGCLVVSLAWLAGCATPRKPASDKSPPEPANISTEDNSAEASERRTEAHARYAAGILYDINEEPEKSAEEFYQAALTDPNDENLVLEASQRLLQVKEN